MNPAQIVVRHVQAHSRATIVQHYSPAAVIAVAREAARGVPAEISTCRLAPFEFLELEVRFSVWKRYSVMERLSDQDRETIHRLRHAVYETVYICEHSKTLLDEANRLLRLADQIERPLLSGKRE